MTPTMEIKEMTENAPEDLKDRLKCAIMDLTPEQAEYVLRRLQCLRQENG